MAIALPLNGCYKYIYNYYQQLIVALPQPIPPCHSYSTMGKQWVLIHSAGSSNLGLIALPPMTKAATLNNQGFIELVDKLGSDASIVRAARVSYNGDTEDRPESRDKGLIRYLLRNGHTSPFEHATLTFHVKAPIFVARQWMRHRTWSFNEVSARYTKVDSEFYVPSEWRTQSQDNKQMSGGDLPSEASQLASTTYLLAAQHSLDAYHDLLDLGVAREMARTVLPQSMLTRFYGTVDLHNLLHFVRLRDHEHAQPEIREYAAAIRGMLVEHFPWTMEAWEETQ